MDTFLDSAHGVYEVATATSIYRVDLQMVLRRVPRVSDRDAVLLRQDNEPIRRVSLIDGTVGRSMTLIIDLHVPGVAFTSRVTIPVLTIDPSFPRQ